MCSDTQLCPILSPWAVAHQASLSMGFSRQEYWSGLPFPFPGDLPNPGVKPASLVSPVLAGGLSTAKLPGKPRRRGGIKVRASRGVRIQDCVSTSLGQDMRRWDFSSLSFLFFF